MNDFQSIDRTKRQTKEIEIVYMSADEDQMIVSPIAFLIEDGAVVEFGYRSLTTKKMEWYKETNPEMLQKLIDRVTTELLELKDNRETDEQHKS